MNRAITKCKMYTIVSGILSVSILYTVAFRVSGIASGLLLSSYLLVAVIACVAKGRCTYGFVFASAIALFTYCARYFKDFTLSVYSSSALVPATLVFAFSM